MCRQQTRARTVNEVVDGKKARDIHGALEQEKRGKRLARGRQARWRRSGANVLVCVPRRTPTERCACVHSRAPEELARASTAARMRATARALAVDPAGPPEGLHRGPTWGNWRAVRESPLTRFRDGFGPDSLRHCPRRTCGAVAAGRPKILTREGCAAQARIYGGPDWLSRGTSRRRACITLNG